MVGSSKRAEGIFKESWDLQSELRGDLQRELGFS